MKLLVTGGAGFIGSNYVRLKVDGDDDIVCLDLLTYAGNMDNLDGFVGKDNFTFVRGDINNRKFVFDLLKRSTR